MAKARVAPTKITTIPRLELTAAVVAVQTSDFLRKELEIDNLHEYFWTDSKVILGYINNDARRFHVFVAKRIQRIRQSTDTTQWRYVTSEDNPADRSYRGFTSEELVSSNWFKGPKFLWQSELPKDDKVGGIIVHDPELKKIQVHKIQAKEKASLLERLHKFSEWTRVVKAIARLMRRAKEIKGLSPRSSGTTSIEERKEAELTIIKMVQQSAFDDEIQSLKQRKEIKSSNQRNKLHRLNPFLDEYGILRVGVQYLINEFWSRWRKEYLLNLQTRQKWHKSRRNTKVNDITDILRRVASYFSSLSKLWSVKSRLLTLIYYPWISRFLPLQQLQVHCHQVHHLISKPTIRARHKLWPGASIGDPRANAKEDWIGFSRNFCCLKASFNPFNYSTHRALHFPKDLVFTFVWPAVVREGLPACFYCCLLFIYLIKVFKCLPVPASFLPFY
ncbi:hypothetical protein IRJ41_004483 [Triplophysa rosa]|uniref:DUF5641 domain-containing protein n=1 Tax=Triplophysa rosa TaxID=992332 RepID=A0A9W7T4Z2_TRIRA|nr:hypothetical protein IRJ41_004483 [Triplophysa rosa]